MKETVSFLLVKWPMMLIIPLTPKKCSVTWMKSLIMYWSIVICFN